MVGERKFEDSKLEALYRLFVRSEQTKRAILLVGDIGIGKTLTTYEFGRRRAEELGRKFVVWHELDKDEKIKVVENAKDYYVLVDVKGFALSPDKIRIPFLIDLPEYAKKALNIEKYVEDVVPLWVHLFRKEESAGVLFIDEINLADVYVQQTFYELLLQRKYFEYALKSKNLVIVAAANPPEANPYVNPIPPPEINRVALINADEIFLTEDAWVKWCQWATERGIDYRVIAYVMYKRSVTKKPLKALEQLTTPRSLSMLGEDIKELDKIEDPEVKEDYLKLIAKAYLAPDDATEFIAFVRKFEQLRDIKMYTRNPDLLREIDEETLIIIFTKLTEMYVAGEISHDVFFKTLDYALKNVAPERPFVKEIVALSIRYLQAKFQEMRIKDPNKYREFVLEATKVYKDTAVAELMTKIIRFVS